MLYCHYGQLDSVHTVMVDGQDGFGLKLSSPHKGHVLGPVCQHPGESF